MLKFNFFVLCLVSAISVSAQLHLGDSPNDLVASLGTDNTKVYDQNGNEVLAYVNEVKDHPKFGNYTLYSLYVCENNACIMQQTLMPLAQKDEVCAGLDALYHKVTDWVWKSDDGVFYILSVDKETLRMKVMSESVYNREIR
jgi:hypothetical protein